ncbi:MAG: phosphomethylpyrimidine synthase ThiC [Novosphingobium sp.]
MKMKAYATQMDAAKRGIVTPEMETVAQKEGRTAEYIRERVARGTVAIPANVNHKSLSAEAVGDGTRVKINVNLGISGDCRNYDMEMDKVKMAVSMGAEAIMDLSNYGKTNTFRNKLIEYSPAMIGTVPMYDAIGYLEKDLLDITPRDFLKVVEAHAKEGVDFMTIHAGINRRAVEAFMREGRKMNIVSRGGSLLFAWMHMTGAENPFFEYYDEVLEILRAYDVTISLGDALRPGCLHDATDAGQISELIELGNLTKRAWEQDVQVMVEGPGHMAMNEIAANMQLQKRLCHGAPFYVLGPLVTDIAPGYDHITSAIGGAIAAQAGANFLCYVTPAEHLRLPNVEDVREGIVASKIAAHAADIACGLPGARDRDNAMADARQNFDWEEQFRLALDPEKAERYYNEVPPAERHSCSMCGKMCAVRTTNMILDGKKVEFCSETESCG